MPCNSAQVTYCLKLRVNQSGANPASCHFLAWRTFWTWRWRAYLSPNRRGTLTLYIALQPRRLMYYRLPGSCSLPDVPTNHNKVRESITAKCNTKLLELFRIYFLTRLLLHGRVGTWNCSACFVHSQCPFLRRGFRFGEWKPVGVFPLINSVHTTSCLIRLTLRNCIPVQVFWVATGVWIPRQKCWECNRGALIYFTNW
jgi:hypothetical protein